MHRFSFLTGDALSFRWLCNRTVTYGYPNAFNFHRVFHLLICICSVRTLAPPSFSICYPLLPFPRLVLAFRSRATESRESEVARLFEGRPTVRTTLLFSWARVESNICDWADLDSSWAAALLSEKKKRKKRYAYILLSHQFPTSPHLQEFQAFEREPQQPLETQVDPAANLLALFGYVYNPLTVGNKRESHLNTSINFRLFGKSPT